MARRGRLGGMPCVRLIRLLLVGEFSSFSFYFALLLGGWFMLLAWTVHEGWRAGVEGLVLLLLVYESGYGLGLRHGMRESAIPWRRRGSKGHKKRRKSQAHHQFFPMQLHLPSPTAPVLALQHLLTPPTNKTKLTTPAAS